MPYKKTSIYPLLIAIFLTLNVAQIAHAFEFDVTMALPAQPIIPENNPQTPEKITLGKQLFFDPRLSYAGDISCNSCHNLMNGGDDDGAVGRISHHQVKRSAPTVWNVGYMSTQYWDGRGKGLESQTIEHLLDPTIMNMGTASRLTARLSQISGYRRAFKQAFGTDTISIDAVARAIANFERTLNTPDSDFDHYIRGDKTALSPAAQNGYELFNEKGCLACHFGVNFAGPAPGPALKMGDGFYELFPNHLGTIYDDKYDLLSDMGRYQISLEKIHKHMWRVPSLRNVSLTAPYFHNGSVKTLPEAVKIMGLVVFKHQLTASEIADITAFLESLTGKFPSITLPRLPDTLGKTLTPH